MADNQRYFTLLTDKGRYKIAKAAADKGEVKFSHFAIGDGNGQETNPLPSANALVHEVWRGQLDSVTTDPKNPAAVVINAIIPHNVGGWWMREFGLFDIDGDMLAVVKPAANYKATSGEGQLEDVFYEFQLVIGEQAQVVVLVDPSILWATREFVETRRIPAQQLANTPWLPVKALDVATPPATNSQGDTYVVPTPAKGEWKDKSGQLAEWNGKSWTYFQTPDGHGIGLPDGSIYIKIAGKYVLLTDLLDKRYSRLTTPPADTFYVVGPSGSDNNSGLKPTAEEGFATIQGAINALSARYITHGTITLKISPGTYSGFSVFPSLVQSWKIIGDPKNPDAYKISACDITRKDIRGCVVYAGTVTIVGLSFSALVECLACSGSGAELTIIDSVILLSKNSVGVGCYGGKTTLYGNINFSGTGLNVFAVTSGASIVFGYADLLIKTPVNIKFNSVQCDSVFNINTSGIAVVNPGFCSFSGTIRGMKYAMSLNATMTTFGGGYNFLPGDQPGLCNSGAQVV